MKLWLCLGSLTMFLGVGLGAFGAHGLKSVLTEEMKSVFQTGVLYHLVHGLAIIAVGLVASHKTSVALNVSGWAFVIGVVLFSGSLYALSITGAGRWGMVTPLGGLAFLIGWGALLVAAL